MQRNVKNHPGMFVNLLLLSFRYFKLVTQSGWMSNSVIWLWDKSKLCKVPSPPAYKQDGILVSLLLETLRTLRCSSFSVLGSSVRSQKDKSRIVIFSNPSLHWLSWLSSKESSSKLKRLERWYFSAGCMCSSWFSLIFSTINCWSLLVNVIKHLGALFDPTELDV